MLAALVARNDADIVGFTVLHLIAQGARVVVWDNLSTDFTRPVLDGIAMALREEGRGPALVIEKDPDPAHRHGEKMTALVTRHAEVDEWVLPVDADELWTGIDKLDALDAVASFAHPFVHVPTHHDQLSEQNPYLRSHYRRPAGEKMSKVAFRYQPGVSVQMGNHGIDGLRGATDGSTLDIRHFQWRTFGQLAEKVQRTAIALDAAGLPAGFGAHIRRLAALDTSGLLRFWREYQEGAMELENEPPVELVLDPAPYMGHLAAEVLGL